MRSIVAVILSLLAFSAAVPQLSPVKHDVDKAALDARLRELEQKVNALSIEKQSACYCAGYYSADCKCTCNIGGKNYPSEYC